MWFSEIKSKAALAMACTLAAATVSQARSMSGEGRNGPDLSGESIPLSVDRLVQVPQIERATKYCFNEYVAGYIISQLQRTPFQLGKISPSTSSTRGGIVLNSSGIPDESMISNTPSTYYGGHRLPVKVGDESFIMYHFSAQTSYLGGARDASESRYVGIEKTNVTTSIGLESNDGELKAVNLIGEGFPILVYQWTKDLTKRDDELGIIKHVVRVSGIRFAGSSSNMIKLVNIDSKVETSLEVSPKRYKDCVMAELSK